MCRGLFIRGQQVFGRIPRPNLTSVELGQLKDWSERFGLNIRYHVPNFHRELSAYVIGQLPKEIRFKLLSLDGIELTGQQAALRLGSTEDNRVSWSLLTQFLGRQSFESEYASAWKMVEAEIVKFENANPDVKAKTIAEVERRVKEIRAASALSNPYQPFYEVTVSQDRIRAPDGKEFKIVKRLANGTIVFEIPFHHILRTEDYRSRDRILYYMQDMARNPKRYQNGVMQAKSPRSIGELTADGRYFIMDGHARTEAYANLHKNVVLVDIEPASDGRFYAMTHYDILRFYSVWHSIPEAERAQIESAATRGSFAEVREAYYRFWGVERLTN